MTATAPHTYEVSRPHAADNFEDIRALARDGLPRHITVKGEFLKKVAGPGKTPLVMPLNSDTYGPNFIELNIDLASNNVPFAHRHHQASVSGTLDLDQYGQLVLRTSFIECDHTSNQKIGRWTDWLYSQESDATSRMLEKAHHDANLVEVLADRPHRKIVWIGTEGLITYGDFHTDRHELKRRLRISGAKTAGPDATAQMINELRKVDSKHDALVVIARGGGRRTSFAPFESSGVAAAIAECQVPVLLAVGHRENKVLAAQFATWTADTPSEAGRIVRSALPESQARFRYKDKNKAATAARQAEVSQAKMDQVKRQATAEASRQLQAEKLKFDQALQQLRTQNSSLTNSIYQLESTVRSAAHRFVTMKHRTISWVCGIAAVAVLVSMLGPALPASSVVFYLLLTALIASLLPRRVRSRPWFTRYVVNEGANWSNLYAQAGNVRQLRRIHHAQQGTQPRVNIAFLTRTHIVNIPPTSLHRRHSPWRTPSRR